MYQYQLTKGAQDFSDCRAIRTSVFVEEQGFCNEFDEIDPIAWHTVVFEGDRAVATGRAFENPDGSYTIGRIAVLKEYRGKGAGSVAVRSLEEKLRELHAPSIHLSAQLQAVGFYQTLGYQRVGNEYLDEHCPHVSMVKDLEP